MFRVFAKVALIVLSLTPVARAGLVLNVIPSSGSYVEGSTGTADVLIYSNSSDQLDSFLVTLNVGGGSGVTFASPQPEAFLSDAAYVFNGRSANIAFSSPATVVSNAGSTVTLGDVSYDFVSPPNANPRTIPGSANPLLLGRFEFLAGAPGNYNLTIDPSSSFSDVGFNTFSFSSTGGSFIVTAVPEPSSLALVTICTASAFWMRRRKQLRASKASLADGTI